MAWTTQFDDLPDLFIIDLFSYLSSTDVLWTFANLNARFQKLVNERGYFRHINLSSALLSKFNALLALLPLDQIQTLVIDIGASSFQLKRWPHLPSLTTLRLYGLRDFEDAISFLYQHSATLTHLTLGTNDRFISHGFVGYFLRPRGSLAQLVQDLLPDLTSLRSLDLGQDTGIGLACPKITMIHSRLTYLRISLQDVAHLYHVMSSKTLSTTLEQFHVTLRDVIPGCEKSVPEDLELPPMMNLHTFTLIQTILSDNRIEWSTVESLTAPNHMPILQQVNLAIFITAGDLHEMTKSLLFTDDRRQ